MRSRVAAPFFASLLLSLAGHADPLEIDLADIVGGGDGSGTGADAGVSVIDGSTTPTHAGGIGAPTNTFVLAANPLVDGVVIPDGGSGGAASVPISSSGLTVTGISDASVLLGSNYTQDHVWNGLNQGTSTSWSGVVLGMHANKGITFDLEAIGAAYGLVPDSFRAMPITGSSINAEADFYAFVDGVLVASAALAGSNQFAPGFESPIPFDARFLTLLVSSNGPNSGDWTAFLDPTLDLVPPLEVGQLDDFDTGFDGWQRGQRIVETGDGFLRIPGPEGIYMITYHHGEQWSGNYLDAGVEQIRLDLRNQGPSPLSVYLAFGTDLSPGTGGEWLATATPVSLPPGGGWGTYDVPIGPGDLVAVQGAATYQGVMSGVETLRILHNDFPDARGAIVNAVLDIDDVEALPEPGAAMLGAGALLGVALAQRRRRLS